MTEFNPFTKQNPNSDFAKAVKRKELKKQLSGRDGVNGRDGRDGIDGRDGKDGIDGKVGKAGKNGRDGLNGFNGKDGKDGVDGRGIQDVKIEDDNLILTYTDGTIEDLGRVVGYNGKNIQSVPYANVGVRGVVNNGGGLDNALLKYDRNTGDATQKTGIIVDDNDNISGIGDITVGRLIIENITVTQDYTAADKRGIFVDATTGNKTITLPELEAGLTYDIQKVDSTSNTVTIKGDSASDKINGSVNKVISLQYTSVRVECNDLATEWFIR